MSRDRPQERCPECGGVYLMEYVGPQDDPHAHHERTSLAPIPPFVFVPNVPCIPWFYSDSDSEVG